MTGPRGRAVPPADLAPGFRARRDLDADRVNGKAEQETKEHGGERHCRAAAVEAAGVAEDEDPGPVFGSQGNRRMETREDAGLANSPVIALLPEFEPQSHSWHAWIGLEVRSEHGRHRFGSQHRAVVVDGGQSQQGGDVASDICGGGVHPASARGRNLAVGNRLEAARAQHIPGGQVRLDPFRSDQVGVLHA